MSTINIKPTELEDHVGNILTFEFPSGTMITGKLDSVYVYGHSIDVYISIRKSEDDHTLNFELFDSQYKDTIITAEAPPLPTEIGTIIRVLETAELARDFTNKPLVLQVINDLTEGWSTLDGLHVVPAKAIRKFRVLKFEDDE